jgi:hypothetical protein
MKNAEGGLADLQLLLFCSILTRLKRFKPAKNRRQRVRRFFGNLHWSSPG